MRIASHRISGRWALLIVLSICAGLLPLTHGVGGAAIREAPTPYTLRDVIREDTAFDRSRFIDTYSAIGHKDPKWDAAAKEFLERSCEGFGFVAEWPAFQPPNAPTLKELVVTGSQLIQAGCDDPTVEYLYAAALTDLNRDVEAAKQLQLARRHMEGKEYPAISVLATAERLKRFSYILGSAQEQQLTNTIEANALKVVRGDKSRVERRCIYNTMRAALTKDRPAQARVVKVIEGMKDADPWLAAMVQGDYEVSAAWDARGADVAAKVTEQGWKGFAQHLSRAHELLTRAWKLDPTLPQSAEEMITVVMGEGGQPGETVYTWFDRARSAQFDDTAAFVRIMWALRPRWGGSIDQMAAIGLSGANSGRFETQAPLWQLLSTYEIADDLRDKDGHTWALPQFWDANLKVLHGYEQWAPAGARRDWFRSWEAAIAWRAGRFEDAKRILDELHGHFDPQRWSIFTKNAELAASQVYAYTGPRAAEARAATKDVEAGLRDKGLHEFEELAAQTDSKDPSAYYFNDYLMGLRAAAGFAKGDWVDFLPKGGVHGWQAIRGSAHVDDQGALVGEWDGSGVLLLGEVDFGKRYEVEAKMEYSAPKGEPAGCGLALDDNGQTYLNGLFFSTGYQSVSPYVNGHGVALSRTIPKTNTLDLKLWDGRFTASLNGKPVKVGSPDGPPLHASGNARLAIYSLYPETDTMVRVTAIRVRRLTERPEELPESASN